MCPSGLSKSTDQRYFNDLIFDELTMTAPPSADTLVSVGLALPPWALASALCAILARISVETFRPWNEDNANLEFSGL